MRIAFGNPCASCGTAHARVTSAFRLALPRIDSGGHEPQRPVVLHAGTVTRATPAEDCEQTLLQGTARQLVCPLLVYLYPCHGGTTQPVPYWRTRAPVSHPAQGSAWRTVNKLLLRTPRVAGI